MCSDSSDENGTTERSSSKNRTGIMTVSICGGIAIAKQRKQLERSKKLMEPGKGGLGCIVVATPGRLWDMIQSWDEFAEGIKHKLDWLILDEADKMIEKGHFEELEKIMKLTNRPMSRRPQQDPSNGQNEEWQDEWGSNPNSADNFVKEKIRTMVFSATMDKNLQINLKKKSLQRKTPAVGAPAPPEDPMHDLLEQIDFRDPHPELIDLTPEGRMVGGLKECKIECVLKDKVSLICFKICCYLP
jgi:ATP-dependent RNA helicase DDX24/MAK5